MAAVAAAATVVVAAVVADAIKLFVNKRIHSLKGRAIVRPFFIAKPQADRIATASNTIAVSMQEIALAKARIEVRFVAVVRFALGTARGRRTTGEQHGQHAG